jgi:hypothetical protein
MRSFSIFTLLTIVSLNAVGQFSHDNVKETAFGMSISTSYHHVAITDLNTFLKDNNLKEIKTGYLNLGAGFNFKFNRHFIQLAGDFDVNEVTEYNDNNVGTSGHGYAVNLNYGYEFNLFDQLKLIPYLGTSRTIFNAKISDKAQPNFNLQSITTNRNAISIDNNTFSINLGSRILIPIGDGDFSYCGLDINYGFKTSSKWTIDEIEISNGSTINPSGLKVGIVLMFMICK